MRAADLPLINTSSVTSLYFKASILWIGLREWFAEVNSVHARRVGASSNEAHGVNLPDRRLDRRVVAGPPCQQVERWCDQVPSPTLDPAAPNVPVRHRRPR